MIKLTAVGVIHSISPVINVSATFSKREVVIDDTWVGSDNTPHPNYVAIEFTGDRIAMLDQFAPGQRVSIEAAVNGRDYNGRYFVSLRGLSIAQPTVQAQPQAPQYAAPAPQPTPAYPPQPSYPQQGYQQPAYYTQPPQGNPPYNR
jgi:hypothetical protein